MKKVLSCPNCETQVAEDDLYCENCGMSLYITENLIQRAAEKDQKAITNIYMLTNKQVYWAIKSMICDDDTVGDIMQDAFIKGFQRLSQLEDPNKFLPWMKRIATNETRNYLKKKKAILFSEMGDEDSDYVEDIQDDHLDNLPEEFLDQQETTRLVQQMLDQLSEEQRLVVGMYYYQQMSVKEIATALECSENTVKSRLNYARKKIEAQVLELEQKGTKLYGLTPFVFFLWLLLSDNKIVPKWSEIQLQNIISATKPTPQSNIPTGQHSEHLPGEMMKAGAKGATATAAKGIGIKAAVVLLGGLVTGGAVAGGVSVYHNRENPAQIVTEKAKNSDEVSKPKDEDKSNRAESPTDPSTSAEAKKVEMTATPELTQNEKAQEAYQSVINSFAKFRDTDFGSYDYSRSEEYKKEYATINSGMLDAMLTGDIPKCEYYAYYDLDGNGTDELLISSSQNTEEAHTQAVYTFDGNSEHELYGDIIHMAYRSYVDLFTNGIILNYSSGGALSGGYALYRIAEDGYSLEKIEDGEVLYDQYYQEYLAGNISPSGFYSQVISGEEYKAKTGQYTKLTSVEWKELPTSDKGSDVTAMYQDKVTSMLNYIDYYLMYGIAYTPSATGPFVFDEYAKTSMICYAEHVYNLSVDETKSKCEEKLKEYFGPSTEFCLAPYAGEITGSIKSLYTDENGMVRYGGGDYAGGDIPVGQVIQILQTGETTYDVTYDEYLTYTDYSLSSDNSPTSRAYRGTYHITLEAADNEYGFIITNIIRTKIATD